MGSEGTFVQECGPGVSTKLVRTPRLSDTGYTEYLNLISARFHPFAGCRVENEKFAAEYKVSALCNFAAVCYLWSSHPNIAGNAEGLTAVPAKLALEVRCGQLSKRTAGGVRTFSTVMNLLPHDHPTKILLALHHHHQQNLFRSLCLEPKLAPESCLAAVCVTLLNNEIEAAAGLLNRVQAWCVRLLRAPFPLSSLAR